MIEEISRRLWADPASSATIENDTDRVLYGALVEQYKIYVEMADRVSSRRNLTNTFFLTLNSAAFTVIGLFMGRQSTIALSKAWLVLPFIALLIQCLAWYWLIRSYRQLNTAKFQVIGALEERLPASPYWRAEWFALGEGTDKSKYWPLTHLEQWVPLLFALIYATGLIATLWP